MKMRATIFLLFALVLLSPIMGQDDEEEPLDYNPGGDEAQEPAEEFTANDAPPPPPAQEKPQVDRANFDSDEEYEEFMKDYEEKEKKNKLDGDIYCGGENCYTILGVTRASSPKEIKKVYRALAKKWHPDKSTLNNLTPEESTKKFAKFGKAYGVVGDERKRKDYDFYLDHPELRVNKSWDLYAPEIGMLPVLIITILLAQSVQLLLRHFNHKANVDSFKYNKDKRLYLKKLMPAKSLKVKSEKGETKKEAGERALTAFIMEKLQDPAFAEEVGLIAPGMSNLLILSVPASLLGGVLWSLRRMAGLSLTDQEKEDVTIKFLEEHNAMSAAEWKRLSAEGKKEIIGQNVWDSAGQKVWLANEEEELKTKRPNVYKKYAKWLKTPEGKKSADRNSFANYLKEYKKGPGIDLGPQADG